MDLQRALASVSPQDEVGAERRSWAVVRGAFAERDPAPRRRPLVRPVLAVALIAAIVAAILSPPGRAVLGQIRDAIAPTRIERSAPALFSLPSRGRLLVDSAAGTWVVRRDGSKRLLGHSSGPGHLAPVDRLARGHANRVSRRQVVARRRGRLGG